MILNVEKPAHGGYCIARGPSGPLFVRGVIPGETIEVEPLPKVKGMTPARLLRVVEPSPDRVVPLCPLYGVCGGCHFQHASYPAQLKMKETILRDALRRGAGVDAPEPRVHPSAPFRYRFRGQFKASATAFGFHREGTNEIVDVTSCPLMTDVLNDAIPAVRSMLGAPRFKEAHLATDGRKVVADLRGAVVDAVREARLTEGGVSGIVSGAWTKGETTLRLHPGPNVIFTVRPGAFFQSNQGLNARLVHQVVAEADRLAPKGRRLDLYAGAGNFAIPLAHDASLVVAVEEEGAAFESLRDNIAANRIENILAVQSRTEEYEPHASFDLVVVDPPRIGMSDRAFKLLLALAPPHLLYVSCDPATLARDIGKLLPDYEIRSVDLFDFFPQTYHLETLVVLSRKTGSGAPVRPKGRGPRALRR